MMRRCFWRVSIATFFFIIVDAAFPFATLRRAHLADGNGALVGIAIRAALMPELLSLLDVALDLFGVTRYADRLRSLAFRWLFGEGDESVSSGVISGGISGGGSGGIGGSGGSGTDSGHDG